MVCSLREEKASLDRALVDADRDVDAVSSVLHRLFFTLGYGSFRSDTSFM